MSNEMHIYFCGYEKCDVDVHDDLREYCLCERVNEEYLRTIIEEPDFFSSIKISLMRRAWEFKKKYIL
jgi:hypothetical protein